MNISPTLADLHDEANWLEWRSRVEQLPTIKPVELVTTERDRAEFLEGARLLRLDLMTRAGDGGHGPTPVQLMIADMLAAGYFLNGILEPRRTTKTTSLQAVLLGRCALREDYQVGWTLCTTGAKAGERFRKDIVVPLERLYPGSAGRPFKINVGKGTEHIAWPHGSHFNVYTPNGEGFRSGGFDAAWADEGGEADPELSEDLTLAVLPTMDTKPGAQFIVSGTGASYRDGNLLFDTLTDPDAAVLWHGIPDNTDPEELEDWEPSEDHPRARIRELIELVHPGVGFTTPIESVARNFAKFPREKFLAEYGGMFGTEGSTSGLIPQPQIERAALALPMPPAPARFAMALAVHPDGLWASVGVAWRVEAAEDFVSEAQKLAGEAQTKAEPDRIALGLLHHQQGVQGLAGKLLTLSRKYRIPLIYDQLSQAAGVEIEGLQRAVPRPTFTPATTSDVRRAATKTVTGFEAGSLVFYREQAVLQRALEIAIKRSIGTAGGFGFGRPKGDYAADITPVEACSLALHFLDDQPVSVKPADAVHF